MSPSVVVKNNCDLDDYKKKINKTDLTTNFNNNDSNNSKTNLLTSTKCVCSSSDSQQKINIFNGAGNRSKYKRSNSECDISHKRNGRELAKTRNRADTLSTLDILRDESNRESTKNRSTYHRLLSYLKRFKRSLSSKYIFYNIF